ncbi:MAG TPA: hypothetical protein RMH99_06490 [Sandaracinaceae bacterium LLY-WYZ-13_1]|nr:hypothetical protein [Sandaracinaceae bacterium LLY-WYZ-13_1]
MRYTGALVSILFVLGCGESHDLGDEDAGPDVGDLAACEVPSDCVVVPESCCGSCGAATRGDAIAVHRDRTGDWRGMACGDDMGCPACFMQQDPTLVATCEAGHCAVVDLQTHPATECASADDCRVRAAECCECGATVEPGTLIAISDEGAFGPLVCDPGMGCPECLPMYPPEVSAACEAGRCVAVGPRDGEP